MADADVAAGQQRIGDAETAKPPRKLGKSGSDTAGLIRAGTTQRRGILYDSARTQAGRRDPDDRPSDRLRRH
jgi:hypothetical protein